MLITNPSKKEWDDFVIKNNGSFLQSYDWAEFKKSSNKKIFFLKHIINSEIALQALIIKEIFPGKKNYLYCPRGPVLNLDSYKKENKTFNDGIFQNFYNDIKTLAQQEKSIFLKIEPDRDFDLDIKKFNFIKSKKEILPSQTIFLDLKKSEEELLKEMKPKTRYNIKLSAKKGVEIKKGDEMDFENFWLLMQETSQRNKFRLHPKDHYKEILLMPNFELWLAKFQNQALVAGIFNFFGKNAIYLHGGSSNENRELMAPYRLHYELIKKAKEKNCENYDFWGISHKYPGVSNFKRNFGGEIINYPGSFDLIFNPFWYKTYQAYRFLRSLI